VSARQFVQLLANVPNEALGIVGNGVPDGTAVRTDAVLQLQTGGHRRAEVTLQSLDKLLRLQLKKQAEAHADHIKDIVAQRETDLTRSFKRELEDKLATEKANYKLQLAGMLGKLRGMDAALAGKLYVLNDIG